MVISVFGKTLYVRGYYAGCHCKQGKAPLDEQFGLKPGAVTAGLAILLALAGIEFSYDKSPKWLQAYLLFDISENTVRSERLAECALSQIREWKFPRIESGVTTFQAPFVFTPPR